MYVFPLRKKHSFIVGRLQCFPPSALANADAGQSEFLHIRRPLCDAPPGSCGHEIVNRATELDPLYLGISSSISHCTSFGYTVFDIISKHTDTAVETVSQQTDSYFQPAPSTRGICFMNGTACSSNWQLSFLLLNPSLP